ncbi:MAG: GAF domain-containing protein, partial [Rhodospirillaceae bacterium]|nr:GAF domain-containing protein [Rhodospirillaceae bacterium]
AYKRPGSLKDGERHFFVGGVFLVAPDNASHLLVAEWGFPPEQHRLNFPLDTGHPGWTWKNRKPLILENTDEHSDFKQILKTSRMGSAMYAPMLWQGKFLGQIITAAQARNTFSRPDRDRIATMAAIATGLFIAKGGPEWLDRVWRETIS